MSPVFAPIDVEICQEFYSLLVEIHPPVFLRALTARLYDLTGHQGARCQELPGEGALSSPVEAAPGPCP